jgi:hypothetical protein
MYKGEKMIKKIILSSLIVCLMLIGCGLIDDDDDGGDEANYVEIREVDDYRYVKSNGIPDHEVGIFPNSSNPFEMQVQSHSFKMPLNPVYLDDPITGVTWPWGVAINGIPFCPQGPFYQEGEFDPHDPFAGIESGWDYELLSGFIYLGHDFNNAHLQPNGSYHYHGMPVSLLQKRESEIRQNQMVLMGYSGGGFPVYGPNGYSNAMNTESHLVELKSSYRLKTGQRPNEAGKPSGAYDGTFVQDYEYVAGLGDLDECNGRYGKTTEYPDGTYYYVLTKSWPFIPRCLHAEPDESFRS